jgi:hypothetical protein
LITAFLSQFPGHSVTNREDIGDDERKRGQKRREKEREELQVYQLPRLDRCAIQEAGTVPRPLFLEKTVPSGKLRHNRHSLYRGGWRWTESQDGTKKPPSPPAGE